MCELEKNAAEKNVSFSLAGCGFLGIYHIGAAACLCEHVPHMIDNAKFCGASAGSLIACCLICHVPMNECVDFTLRLARSSGQYPLGGWEPGINIEAILRSSIDQVLPANAHELCTDRLFISVTTLSSLKNQIISKFDTRKELIDALLCSAYVPAFSSYTIPKFGDEYLLDGGLSDNLPILDSDTITICPWAGEHSICPQDPEGQSFPLTMLNMSICPSTHNLARFKDAFFSPKPETLKNYCWQGYDDALRFLHENHLIHCNVHRVLAVLTNLEHRISVNCADCEHHRDHARNCQLSADILAKWDNSEGWWAKSYGSLVFEPVKKWVNIWFIPVTMLRDCILQLFMLAYFKVDQIRNGGLSAEVIRLVKKLYKPKELLWELFLVSMTNIVLRGAEYWCRVFSELVGLTNNIRYAKQVICHEICRKCGLSYSQPAGPVKEVVDKLKEGEEEEEVVAATVETVPKGLRVGPPEEEEKEGVPVIVVQGHPEEAMELNLGEVAEDGETSHPPAATAAAETVAVWMDIHADSVNMALSVPPEQEGKEPATTEHHHAPAAETVHVEGVGEIKEVVINPVLVSPAPKAASIHAVEGAPKKDKRQKKSERIHHYVHKFEQLKNIMTLHYVDENLQHHTESLFVEPLGSDTETEESVAGGPEGREEELMAQQRGRREEEEQQAEVRRPQDAAAASAAEHDVEMEVRQLLEDKLFTGQRQFEKDYETIHQRRLKKNRRREVKTDTGHFRLQLISFGTDTPPSPNLSRSSSLRNVSLEEEGELVRSVSDACNLVSSMRKLRERKTGRAGVESPLCASHSNLAREQLPLCASHRSLAASIEIPSLQSAAAKASPRAPLVKSQSDTSDVLASLRLMKAQRSQAREVAPLQRDGSGTTGRRQIPRVATAPFELASAGASSDGKSGAGGGRSSGDVSKQRSLLPVKCDVPLASQRIPQQQQQPAFLGWRDQRPTENVCGMFHHVPPAPPTSDRLSSRGRKSRGGREQLPGVGGRRLERSHAVHGSARTQLLSSLQELQAMSQSSNDDDDESTPTSTTTSTTPSTISSTHTASSS
ncbi:uncharacterized protein LOC143301234 [Babylonia areolata]|uniref:uncharacterized protein LOC143301234 n=1 Tax=Babylonia areolata TaxID=304850 RepID=UPI003FD1D6EF